MQKRLSAAAACAVPESLSDEFFFFMTELIEALENFA